MTATFWFYTITLIVLSSVILGRLKKTKKSFFRTLGWLVIMVMLGYYIIHLVNRPYIVNSKMIVNAYKNFDTSQISSVELFSKNKDEKYFKQTVKSENKLLIESLCKNLKYSEKFRTDQSPKIFKVYNCKLNFKDDSYIEFPIKVSAVFGCYFEIYAPGDFIEEHLGDFNNDSLRTFIKLMYYPEEIDLEYHKDKFKLFKN